MAYRNLTTVSGSLIRFTKGQGAGIAGLTRKGTQTTVKADGVTIVGPELPLTFGAEALTGILTASPVDLSLTNSIIRGVSNSLYSAAIGAGQANLTTSYSDYDPASTLTSGGNGTITQANVSNLGDARFVDAAGGDYHLRPDSPLIDTGDPATPQGLDLDGNPLVADGNADGIARRDMGAFELQPPPAGGGEPAGTGQQGGGSQGGQSAGTGQPGGGNQAGPTPADTQPPLITGFRPDPSVFAVAHARTATAARVSRGTHLRYTLSEPARVTITIQRPLAGRRKGANCLRPSPRLKRAKHCTRHPTTGTLTRTATNGANSTTLTGRIGRRALPRGNFLAIITATDAAGNRSAPKAARFRIATP